MSFTGVPLTTLIQIGALAGANIGQLIGLLVSIRITRGTFRFVVPLRELTRIVAATVAMAIVYRLVAVEGDLVISLLAMGGMAPPDGASLSLPYVVWVAGLEDDNVHAPNEKFDLDALHNGTRTAAALYEKLKAL